MLCQLGLGFVGRTLGAGTVQTDGAQAHRCVDPQGRVLAEQRLVHGAGHAWIASDSTEIFVLSHEH